MRVALLLAWALPLAAQTAPLSPFDEAKARALLHDRLPCLGCHELDGDGGRIGPSLTDVAARRSAAYIAQIIEDPQRVAPAAAMPKTLMPASARELITRYLARRRAADAPPPAPSPSPAPPLNRNPAPSLNRNPAPPLNRNPAPPLNRNPAPSLNRNPAPAALYATWCAGCHGTSGRGDGANARFLPVPPADHTNAARMRKRPDDSLFDTIAGGGAVMGKSPRMPPFGATLAREEISALVRYIRQLCGCRQPSWAEREGR